MCKRFLELDIGHTASSIELRRLLEQRRQAGILRTRSRCDPTTYLAQLEQEARQLILRT